MLLTTAISATGVVIGWKHLTRTSPIRRALIAMMDSVLCTVRSGVLRPLDHGGKIRASNPIRDADRFERFVWDRPIAVLSRHIRSPFKFGQRKLSPAKLQRIAKRRIMLRRPDWRSSLRAPYAKITTDVS
jgi:hypothetical protein